MSLGSNLLGIVNFEAVLLLNSSRQRRSICDGNAVPEKSFLKVYDAGQLPLRGVPKCQICCVLGAIFHAFPFSAPTSLSTLVQYLSPLPFQSALPVPQRGE